MTADVATGSTSDVPVLLLLLVCLPLLLLLL
jgi:hypothetical protein